MAGILFKNVACWSILDCNCSKTNSRVPTGVPRMMIPLSLGPLSRSPLQTLASGSTRAAATCRTSILVGASPLLLKAHVLPWFRRILACCHNSSAKTMWHSTVRSGGGHRITNRRGRPSTAHPPSCALKPQRGRCAGQVRRGGASMDRLVRPPRPGGCGGWSQRRPPTEKWRGCCQKKLTNGNNLSPSSR